MDYNSVNMAIRDPVIAQTSNRELTILLSIGNTNVSKTVSQTTSGKILSCSLTDEVNSIRDTVSELEEVKGLINETHLAPGSYELQNTGSIGLVDQETRLQFQLIRFINHCRTSARYQPHSHDLHPDPARRNQSQPDRAAEVITGAADKRDITLISRLVTAGAILVLATII